jgi:dTDP-L-rhamnose 4-epimerase
MQSRILITGGAGFVGSHLAERLLGMGHFLRILDSFDPQVHGDDSGAPRLHPGVELIRGDIRDRDAVARGLEGVDAVIHLAAAVGVGQSMYDISHYLDVNVRGTGVLLEEVARRGVGRLLVASSMSVYGEGLYQRPHGVPDAPPPRPRPQLLEGRWDPLDGEGQPLSPRPTPETKSPAPTSVYAVSKYNQEQLCLMIGEAYGIPTVALRFFNIYGPRQALSNPYTGVLAIFASRVLNGNPPLVFEDGEQMRDFVHVRDVVNACCLALSSSAADGETVNVGSGEPRTVLEVAEAMCRVLGREDLSPQVTGRYRVGDIRHCYADIRKARTLLDYRPRVDFEQGLAEYAFWLSGQQAEDRVLTASAELDRRGLRL